MTLDSPTSRWSKPGRRSESTVDSTADLGPDVVASSTVGSGIDPTLRSSVDGLAVVDAGDVDSLDRDPFDDDLAAELAKRTPRGTLSRTTLALGGAVLIVAGFLGGVVVQKNLGTTTPASANGAGTGTGGFAGRGAGAGAGTASAAPGGQRGGAPTTGTVKFVDGTTVYLTTADGQTVTVKTTGTTTVRAEQTTTLAEIPVGATVSVQGTTDADGNLTATQVTTQK